ncbi:kinase RLK-Pelle-LRR-I-1 family protein [Tanacetum coccineum]
MSYEDIKLATQNFSRGQCHWRRRLRVGYKGEMEGHSTIVAKRLDTSLGQGEQQFYSELQIPYEYKHENVIGFLGYTNETHEKIIVYGHASKGSLDRYHNDASLTLRKRLKICIDVASGLDFLHRGVQGKEVINRDIKTPNILLFDDWKAKVSDFGLALICPIIEKIDYVIDHACGTPGYLDPLGNSGFLTIESDIYSFGVVLFEILCGRSTFAVYKHEGRFLNSYVKDRFEEGKQDNMVFEAIKEHILPKSLTTFQTIAYQCLHDDREKRPTADEVLAQLKKALEFQVS